MFVYGFILVAPAVFALILMDLVIGFAARVMPQVNAYFVALPAKAFVGLLVTAISLRFSGGVVQSLFETDLPARLDRLPWGRFHTLLVFALGITWLLDGLEVTLAGSVSGAFESQSCYTCLPGQYAGPPPA